MTFVASGDHIRQHSHSVSSGSLTLGLKQSWPRKREMGETSGPQRLQGLPYSGVWGSRGTPGFASIRLQRRDGRQISGSPCSRLGVFISEKAG